MKTPSPVPARNLVFVLLFTLLVAGLFPSCGKFGSNTSAQRDAIINDLTQLVPFAYQYRSRPDSLGGGAGSYLGFTIPSGLTKNENATYSVKEVTADNVTFVAVSAKNPANMINVSVDSTGKPAKWIYFGEFM